MPGKLNKDQIRIKNQQNNQQHTVDNMHTEQAQADIFDRKMMDTWKQSGSKTAKENAEERAREILETHEPEPLDDAVKDKLREIVESAKK